MKLVMALCKNQCRQLILKIVNKYSNDNKHFLEKQANNIFGSYIIKLQS